MIKIKCRGAAELPIDSILEFQGGLKKLSKKNLEKLKARILEDGFISPIFIWEFEGDNYILDGHQRLKALSALREEGYNIPLLPVVYIDADNERDARRKLLSITSQYGEFEIAELGDWLDDFEIEIQESLRFCESEIKIDNKPNVNLREDKEKSNSEDNNQKGIRCEKCGHLNKTHD